MTTISDDEVLSMLTPEERSAVSWCASAYGGKSAADMLSRTIATDRRRANEARAEANNWNELRFEADRRCEKAEADALKAGELYQDIGTKLEEECRMADALKKELEDERELRLRTRADWEIERARAEKAEAVLAAVELDDVLGSNKPEGHSRALAAALEMTRKDAAGAWRARDAAITRAEAAEKACADMRQILKDAAIPYIRHGDDYDTPYWLSRINAALAADTSVGYVSGPTAKQMAEALREAIDEGDAPKRWTDALATYEKETER